MLFRALFYSLRKGKSAAATNGTIVSGLCIVDTVALSVLDTAQYWFMMFDQTAAPTNGQAADYQYGPIPGPTPIELKPTWPMLVGAAWALSTQKDTLALPMSGNGASLSWTYLTR